METESLLKVEQLAIKTQNFQTKPSSLHRPLHARQHVYRLRRHCCV